MPGRRRDGCADWRGAWRPDACRPRRLCLARRPGRTGRRHRLGSRASLRRGRGRHEPGHQVHRPPRSPSRRWRPPPRPPRRAAAPRRGRESMASRARSCSRTASASSPPGSRPRSRIRRIARSSTEASRYTFRSASGQHDRADVPAGHDDPARRCEPALVVPAAPRGHRAGGRPPRRPRPPRAPRTASVASAPSSRTRRQAPVAVVGEHEPRDQRDHGRLVVESHALSQGERGQRPVDQPGVEEPQAQPLRHGDAHRALPARGGPVEGDDDLRGGGAGHRHRGYRAPAVRVGR